MPWTSGSTSSRSVPDDHAGSAGRRMTRRPAAASRSLPSPPPGRASGIVRGRLVLADRVAPGRLVIEDGWITAVEPDPLDAAAAAGPIYRTGLHRRPRPWLGRPCGHRRCRRALGHGPRAAAPGRDLVPAHGALARGGRAAALRGPGPVLDAGRSRGWRRAAGVQPGGTVPRPGARGRPRPRPPADARLVRRRGDRRAARRAARRPADHDDRARASRRAGAHPQARRARDRPVHGPLVGDAR